MEAPMGHTNELLFLNMLSVDERRARNSTDKWELEHLYIYWIFFFYNNKKSKKKKNTTKGAVSQGVLSALAIYSAKSSKRSGLSTRYSK